MERIVRIPAPFDKECFTDPRLRRHFSKLPWAHFRTLALAIIAAR